MSRNIRIIMLTLTLFFVGVIGVLLAHLFFNKLYLIDMHVTDVEFQVVEGSHIGFNLDTAVLQFGKVPKGGGASRTTTISSEIPATAVITVSHNLHEWLVPSSYKVVLGSDPVNITFNLNVPKEAAPGNYTGQVYVKYLRRW